MNTVLKNIIIQNEERILEVLPKYKARIAPYICRLKQIKYDRNLYDYITISFGPKANRIEQIYDYHRLGFKTSYEILMDNIDDIDLKDDFSCASLIEGNLYTYFDVCCLANNYNQQVGMYILRNRDVVIKCTVDDFSRVYNDKWIKKDVILKYCMQKETDKNIKNLTFGNRPNAEIFDALMNEELINIYVFVNQRRADEYTYKGVFHPCGLIDGNKSFILFKDTHENEIPYDNFDGEFISALNNDHFEFDNEFALLTYKNALEITSRARKMFLKSKRNSLQRKKIKLEVNFRAEQLVLYSEIHKLNIKGYKKLAENVQNVTLCNENLGYDIKSYNIDESGDPYEIFIKVIGSTSNTEDFILKESEIKFARNHPNYRIYKVYDIYTDNPKCYVLGTNNNDKLNIKKSVAYKCSLEE